MTARAVPSPAYAQALIRIATAVAEPIRLRNAAARRGELSAEDAAALRIAVQGLGLLRAEGQRVAAAIDFSEFAEWVALMVEVERNTLTMLDGLHPTTAP